MTEPHNHISAANVELKPCPFCGEHEAERNSDRWGHFFVCNCGVRSAYGSTPGEAFQAWNHRGDVAQPSAMQALEAFVRAYGAQESTTKGLDDAYQAAKAALATQPPAAPLAQSTRVPEGWKLVPIEPTQEMVRSRAQRKSDV